MSPSDPSPTPSDGSALRRAARAPVQSTSNVPVTASTDVDTIYVSDAGTQTAWHPDSTSHGASLECGHVDYQVLGGPPECPLTWLTTPPGACDDLLP